MLTRLVPGSSDRTGIQLGVPEAEGESSPDSLVPLVEVYEDFHHLSRQLSQQNFVLVGRKGCGKSAFAEYVYAKARGDANFFCGFVRGSDCSFERLVQLGTEAAHEIEGEALFEWLVLTNLLKLILGSESVAIDPDYVLLERFLAENSGYVSITEFELKELVRRQGWSIDLEQFRAFFKGKYARDIEAKSGRAPFFRLLPDLRRVIADVLSREQDEGYENSYLVFFDDLDIGFDGGSEESCNSLMALLRAVKRINLDLFGRAGLNAKAIVLLRDDIEQHLSGKYADSAKLFASYSTKIVWFQSDNDTRVDEDDLFLKQFIDRRIRYAFKHERIPFDDTNPWDALVAPVESNITAFKYITNQTLYRPRDLLLFFAPLSSGAFQFPLDRDSVQSLVNQYSAELAKEVKNELSSFYSSEQVEMVFSAVAHLVGPPTTYEEALGLITAECSGIDISKLIQRLFQRSIIGNVDSRRHAHFKCREPVNPDKPLAFDPTMDVALQYGIQRYLRRQSY